MLFRYGIGFVYLVFIHCVAYFVMLWKSAYATRYASEFPQPATSSLVLIVLVSRRRKGGGNYLWQSSHVAAGVRHGQAADCC